MVILGENFTPLLSRETAMPRLLLCLCFVGTVFLSSAIRGQAPAADTVSVPQLIKNLDSPSLKVAASAARSLGVVFAPGGKGGPELTEVTKLLTERLASTSGADLRREAAIALGRMQAASAVEPLTKAMADEDIAVAVAAGEAVGQVLPVDDARKLLLTKAEDPSEQMQTAACSGLAPICKAEDAGVLAKGLAGKNWRLQQAAVKGLERAVRAGAKLEPAQYDAVTLVLGTETPSAADTALHFFTHVRNDESSRALLKAIDTRGDGGKEDATWRVRTYALRTVWHLGWEAQRDAIPAVARQVGDPIANVSNEARRILNNLRKDNIVSQADLFPVLLTELEKAEPLTMRAGLMSEMHGDVDRQYASRVAKAASKTLHDASESKEAWPARAYAARLIGASGYTGDLELLAQCCSDDIQNVRAAAGKALEDLSPLCKAEQRTVVAPILMPLLVKPVDWRKTAVAARAVGYYANPDVVEPLTLLLGHSVINVREGASHALVVIAQSGDAQLAKLVDASIYPELEKNTKAWEYGAHVLGALEDRKAAPLLTTILTKGEWHAQAAAAKAVAQIADKNKLSDQALSDALIQAAQSDVLQVQDAANNALRVLNQGAK